MPGHDHDSWTSGGTTDKQPVALRFERASPPIAGNVLVPAHAPLADFRHLHHRRRREMFVARARHWLKRSGSFRPVLRPAEPIRREQHPTIDDGSFIGRPAAGCGIAERERKSWPNAGRYMAGNRKCEAASAGDEMVVKSRGQHES